MRRIISLLLVGKIMIGLSSVECPAADTAGTGFGLWSSSGEANDDVNAVVTGVDIDGDGNGEIVVITDENGANDDLLIFECNGDGSFTQVWATSRDNETVEATKAIAVGDTDGDGKMEIIVGRVNTDQILVYEMTTAPGDGPIEENSNPPETPVKTFSVDAGPRGITIGDLDNDGNKEIIAAIDSPTGSVRVWEGTGNDTWTESFGSIDIAYGANSVSGGASDLDGDGANELAIATGDYGNTDNGSRLMIVSLTGSTFTTELDVKIAAEGTPQDFNYVLVGNVDQSGREEIVFSTAGGDRIFVYQGTATDTYSTDESNGIDNLGYNINGLAVGDHDNDGNGEIYYATSNDKVYYKEHTGPTGRFLSGDFTTRQTLVSNNDSVNYNGVAYSSAGGRLLDGDLYRDIAVVRASSSSAELIVVESNTSDSSLPVELLSFIPVTRNAQVTLHWLTQSEINTAGFNILRGNSLDGEYSRINGSLIPAKGDAFTGASYSYADFFVVNGVTYFYQLEDVEFDGTAELHGPVAATPGPIALMSPMDGQVVSASFAPLFKWHVDRRTRSRLLISLTRDFDGRNSLAFGVRRDQSSLRLPQKSWRSIVGKVKRSQGRLYWRVNVKSPSADATFSTINKLCVAPTALRLVSPVNGAAASLRSDIAFSFVAEGAENAHIEISSGRDFPKRGTLRARVGRGATSARVGGGRLRRLQKLSEKGGGVIFWRVRAREVGTKQRLSSEVRFLRIQTP